MTEEYLPENVDIYISYTRRAEKDKQIADDFFDACENHPKVTPHIDREDIRLGDSIYQYMDTLSAARFVVCVFSEDYFKSENCVLEFAGLCAHGFMEERVFPLFVEHLYSDDRREEIMTALAGNTNLHNRVKEKTGFDLASILEQGRTKYMEQFVGTNQELAAGHQGDHFAGFITQFLDTITEHNKARLRKHRKRLAEQIGRKLLHPDLKPLLPNLSYELGCTEKGGECAKKLVNGDALAGISVLINAAKDANLQAGKNRFFLDVVGLLLIGTINPGWWLMNEYRLLNQMATGDGLELGDLSNYVIEIVMARFFNRPATHCVTPDGEIISENQLGQAEGITFSADENVMKDSYIRWFYQDVTATDVGTREVTPAMMTELRGRLKVKLREGRQYFYIISKDSYQELDEVGAISAINDALDRMVQFIVVGGTPLGTDDQNVVSVDSEVICGYLSTILKQEKK